MASEWTAVEKLADQTARTYNEAGVTYNQEGMQYNGKQQAIATPVNKS